MEINKQNKEKIAFVLEIAGILGGICTFLALLFGPMLYLGSKIDNSITGLRTEIRSDMAAMRTEMRSDMAEFRNEIKTFREEWAKESKDFHARLCINEEKINQ